MKYTEALGASIWRNYKGQVLRKGVEEHFLLKFTKKMNIEEIYLIFRLVLTLKTALEWQSLSLSVLSY